ncbi:MAG: YicC family protein [Defluviitaleaceae bacterium]|nr:YicC family protein [Defluviitaleaceae bacterium]
MLKSMTGFGRGEYIHSNRKFKVEIKSVNHRFSDYSIKLPRFLNPFEEKIRHRLAQDIVRGKVDVWVGFESFTPEDITIHVNEIYADAYMNVLKALRERYEIEAAPSLELLVKMPDVIVTDRYESALATTKTQIWEGLSAALELALKQYNYMRETEGAALSANITENLANAYETLEKILERTPHAVNEYRKRLEQRVNELTNHFTDDSRLITEIALLADKHDIHEEMTRLASHIEQLNNILNENGAAGRKMDFLMQELNREANTIGSKVADINLTKLVIELKSCIEKIREQVQNIE